MNMVQESNLNKAGNQKIQRVGEINVLDLFDQQVKRYPNNIAANFQSQCLTYRQLYDASIRVAAHLKQNGFKTGDRVPLLTSMGLEMVAAVLGILRLGAAYCPMDSNAWSSARILAALESVGSRLVFGTVEMSLLGYEMVRITDILGQKSHHISQQEINDFRAIRQRLRLSDLIYIIFTSGTTGKPKGVMVSHSSAVHLVQQTFPGALRVSSGERILLFFSVAFDGCAGVIFSTLCHGGTLAMATPSDVIDVAGTCTTLIVTPSILASLAPTPRLDKVRAIYMGGEAPTESLVETWTTPTRKIYNSYGPTECTTAVSTIELTPGGPIVLGNLVSDVEILLLDDDLLHEVEQGEICIRGPCLAVGYLNNETLTNQKFFFRDGVRHYRTGDLARRGPDGLHFVARVDRVVKNRGFLINLDAEVEPALRSFTGVRLAAAFMSRKQLWGFITPESIEAEALRDHLQTRYENFVVPDLLFAVDDFPLTANGKVDTRALQAHAETRMDLNATHYANLERESNLMIKAVADIFATVFDRPASQISYQTSFRSLGGNSLTAVKLVSHLRRDQHNVPLHKVFELDTVAAIAQALTPTQAQHDPPSQVKLGGRTAPLTPHQSELLRGTREDPSSNIIFYSLTRDVKDGDLLPLRLKHAWNLIFQRHEIYRTTFDAIAEIQTVHDIPQFEWTELTVSNIGEMNRISDQERQALWNQLNSQHDNSIFLMPRFWIVECPGKAIRMNWVVHHLYTDAWSFGILLEEIGAILQGHERDLQEPASFIDMAQNLSRQLNHKQAEIRDFWVDYLRPWPELRQIQLPAPDTPSTEPWGMWENDIPLTKLALDSFASANGVSSATVIYTAWALLLAEYTRSKTVGMKVSVSGRNLDYVMVDRVVGAVNGRCPLIVQAEADASVTAMMMSLQRDFFRVNDMQWTYPELRKYVPQGPGTYWLDSDILVLLDMPVNPGQWKIFEVQKPTAPVWLGITQKGEALNLRLRYDCGRYSATGIEQMAENFSSVFEKLVACSEDSLGRGQTLQTSAIAAEFAMEIQVVNSVLKCLSTYPFVSFGIAFTAYLILLATYRLVFHPLAKYPGRKLAALTVWYEFYYDGIKRGRYTFEIQRMHEKYGPVVRISPDELHVNEPSFIDELYAGAGKKRDKYPYSSFQFGIPDSVFGTPGHDLHRLRRSALNRFFSKASVNRLEPMIYSAVEKLASQLRKYVDTGDPINMTMAFSCLTTDVVTEYAFSKSYNFLNSPTFEPNFHRAIIAGTDLGPWTKQFPWIIPLMNMLPSDIVTRINPEAAAFVEFQQDMRRQIKVIQDRVVRNDEGKEISGTIFHELLTGDLPDKEKRLERLWQEGQIVIGAGTETTAWTLTATLFYILDNRQMLAKLQAELLQAFPDVDEKMGWSRLEQLPYLSAIVCEGLRLSYGVSTRLQRINPSGPLHFKAGDSGGYSPCVEYTIPKGTPVGMTATLIHTHPDLFPDPLCFRPERWLDENGHRHTGLDKYLLSFSRGSRQCIEIYMALGILIRRMGSSMSLFETGKEDVEIQYDRFVPAPKDGSQGVRIIIGKKAGRVSPDCDEQIMNLK
nr:nonribosomal peptide synthetase sirp [Quercus suber]POE94740.1 nonribosomal peptide synthetase sirp [Quercus suber]